MKEKIKANRKLMGERSVFTAKSPLKSPRKEYQLPSRGEHQKRIEEEAKAERAAAQVSINVTPCKNVPQDEVFND